jgi:hypothetical protein
MVRRQIHFFVKVGWLIPKEKPLNANEPTSVSQCEDNALISTLVIEDNRSLVETILACLAVEGID